MDIKKSLQFCTRGETWPQIRRLIANPFLEWLFIAHPCAKPYAETGKGTEQASWNVHTPLHISKLHAVQG